MNGTWAMVRLILRRDRVRLAVWVLSLAALTSLSVESVQGLYADEAALAEYGRAIGDNAAVIAFSGPPLALDTFGGRTIFEISTQLSIAISILVILTVTRHTRAEEESGRAELLRSTRMGRHAQLAAAVMVAGSVSAVIGLSITACMVAAGLPAHGSIAFGAAMGALGIFFVGVAAVTAQVTSHTRAASGLAFAVLGGAFIVRAVGDVGAGWVSWTSPIGIAQQSRGFADERWWPMPLLVLLAAALGFGAVQLARRRDLGGGLVPDQPGPPVAGRRLAGPLALSVRVQRGMVAGWSAGLLLIGVPMGWMATSVNDLIADNPDMAKIFTDQGIDLVSSFLATILLMFGTMACGFSLQSAVGLRAEETSGRTELALVAGVPRARWPLAHLAVTTLGTVVVFGALGLGVGLGHAAQTGDLEQVPRVIVAALALVPAGLVLVGIAMALFGWSSRATVAAWAPLPLIVVVGMLGDLLSLPDWVSSLSPFTHLAEAPAEPFELLPAVVLLLLAALATVTGLVGWQRRDVAT